jgi:hypothetical protein
VQCPDKNLVGPVVTKCAPGAVDAAAQRGLGDDPAIPDRLYQFILADNAIMIADEVNDDIEHLRLNMNGLAEPAQLMLAEVYLKLAELVQHYHLSDANAIRGPATIRQLNDTIEQNPRCSKELRQACTDISIYRWVNHHSTGDVLARSGVMVQPAMALNLDTGRCDATISDHDQRIR